MAALTELQTIRVTSATYRLSAIAVIRPLSLKCTLSFQKIHPNQIGHLVMIIGSTCLRLFSSVLCNTFYGVFFRQLAAHLVSGYTEAS